MTRYGVHANKLKTSQSEQARPDQVKNNAGGYAFALDHWKRLDRFLILGAEGGTYYVGERKLTRENAKAIDACIAEDGPRTVRRIVEISDAGRAPKNDPAIFALAVCAGAKDPETRKAATAALSKVCRIGTHLFHFAADIRGFRGWGPSLRKAVARWYESKDADKLAYDLIKYQQRDGWGHKDMLRLSHPSSPTPKHKAAFAWSSKGGAEAAWAPTKKQGGGERGTPAVKSELPEIISAFEEIHSGVDARRAIELIRKHNLPHECVPNELKSQAAVWEALSERMGLTALVRNLGKMTAVGTISPMSKTSVRIVERLTDSQELFRARMHPISLLIALKTYVSGHGVLGSLSWSPVREVVDALDDAFYKSFEAIEPTGKRHLLALDVSGSMEAPISGSILQCREAAAAMAMATAKSEKIWHCVGFTCAPSGYGGRWGGGHPGLTPIAISPRQRLDDVVQKVARLPMGGTDCSLPMQWALQTKTEVDAFVVLTDNETWHGKIHPFQALVQYRMKMGIDAKLIVVGMTSSGFTIADPTDAGMLDVVGFDSATPAIMADFVAEREALTS